MSTKQIAYKGKTYNVFTIETDFGTFDVILTIQQYQSNGSLAVQALTVEDGNVVNFFEILTVNLDGYTGMGVQDDKRAFVDTNNCDWAERFLKKNKLAKGTGIKAQSGFCTYPLYEWDTSKFFAETK